MKLKLIAIKQRDRWSVYINKYFGSPQQYKDNETSHLISSHLNFSTEHLSQAGPWHPYLTPLPVSSPSFRFLYTNLRFLNIFSYFHIFQFFPQSRVQCLQRVQSINELIKSVFRTSDSRSVLHL